MAYTSLNFVPGEILTAAKMNLLAANDASLRDGTGILDNSIQLSKIKSGKLTWHDVQFQNGFKNYGGVYHNCQYAKDSFDNIHLIGLAANSATNATERPIFTLPAGYRPSGQVIFPAPNAGTIGRVDIQANGEVRLSSAYGPNSSFVSLSGIVFKAA